MASSGQIREHVDIYQASDQPHLGGKNWQAPIDFFGGCLGGNMLSCVVIKLQSQEALVIESPKLSPWELDEMVKCEYQRMREARGPEYRT